MFAVSSSSLLPSDVVGLFGKSSAFVHALGISLFVLIDVPTVRLELRPVLVCYRLFLPIHEILLTEVLALVHSRYRGHELFIVACVEVSCLELLDEVADVFDVVWEVLGGVPLFAEALTLKGVLV